MFILLSQLNHTHTPNHIPGGLWFREALSCWAGITETTSCPRSPSSSHRIFHSFSRRCSSLLLISVWDDCNHIWTAVQAWSRTYLCWPHSLPKVYVLCAHIHKGSYSELSYYSDVRYNYKHCSYSCVGLVQGAGPLSDSMIISHWNLGLGVWSCKYALRNYGMPLESFIYIYCGMW